MNLRQFVDMRTMLRAEHEKVIPEAAGRIQPGIDANAPRYGEELGVRGFTL